MSQTVLWGLVFQQLDELCLDNLDLQCFGGEWLNSLTNRALRQRVPWGRVVDDSEQRVELCSAHLRFDC